MRQPDAGFPGVGLGLLGSNTALGEWDPSRMLRMHWSPGQVWVLDVIIPMFETVEYKVLITYKAFSFLPS